MTTDELLRAKWRQPFQPFRLVLANGTVYEVTTPSLLEVGFGISFVGQPPQNDAQGSERCTLVDNGDIVRLEPITSADSAQLPITGWGCPLQRPQSY